VGAGERGSGLGRERKRERKREGWGERGAQVVSGLATLAALRTPSFQARVRGSEGARERARERE
jgi:hypothetical protein